jgi:lysophospholipase L1-like esterase
LQSKKEVNASCPGETSGSFLDIQNLDNGCNHPHTQPPPTEPFPFKTSVGLHTNYTGSQMDFAVAQLTANKHIDLVTLSIGANDAFLALPALESCSGDPVCVLNVLQPYANNLTKILTGLRAHYQGTLILLTYYSPSPVFNGLTAALNYVMIQVASQLSAQPNFAPITIADGFTAFQLASVEFNGDACAAGLLIKLPSPPAPPSTCDIHPSPLGQALLADTVELAQESKH